MPELYKFFEGVFERKQIFKNVSSQEVGGSRHYLRENLSKISPHELPYWHQKSDIFAKSPFFKKFATCPLTNPRDVAPQAKTKTISRRKMFQGRCRVSFMNTIIVKIFRDKK